MAFLSCASDFSPLFRLLDDYETHRSYSAPTRSSGCKPTPTSPSLSPSTSTRRTIFMPAFDVRELNDAYYLDGELPGVDQSNIDIEFTDPQTLVVKGRTERNYHHSTTSTSTSPQVELEPEQPRGQDTPTTSASRTSSPSGWHQPTVEDDEDDQGNVSDARSTSSSSTRSTARSAVIVEKPSAAPAARETSSTSSSSSPPKEQEQEHYWVAERSIGEFQRTFAFATRVDEDGVRAALKNGILSIVVPKEAAPKTKKIRVY